MSAVNIDNNKAFYQSDQATLYVGDALSILQALPSCSVDAVITDPPYSSGGQSTSAKKATPGNKYIGAGKGSGYIEFEGDNKDQRSYFMWWLLWANECKRIMKPGAPFVAFTDWRQYPIVSDAFQIAGLVWRGTAVWDKTKGTRPHMGRYRQQSEFILWGSHGPMAKNRDVGALPGVFTHSPMTGGAKHHMTAKPIKLMEEVVGIAPIGGVVLDPFAGSASTGVASINTGRKFIGIEYVEDYGKIAANRLDEAEKKTA